MTTIVTVVAALVAVATGTWLLYRPATLVPSSAGAKRGSVSVIVPARNEAGNVAPMLAALAAALREGDEVIVVDDSSHDATATLAAGAGATVVHAPPLPSGWMGKPWACSVGAEHARNATLLFLDADTRLAPAAVDALCRVREEAGGLVSVQPHHQVRRPYERLSAVFNLVSVMGSGAFGVRRPPSSPGVAFGPCMLTTAADYRRVGGHAAVRGEIVEDMALARRYVDAGMPSTCLLGGSQVTFRMYPDGLRPLVQGWTKNIAAGAKDAPAAAVLPAVAWVAAVAAVTAALIAGVIGWFGTGRAPWIEIVAWLTVSTHLGTMLRRVGSFGWWTAILLVVPLLFFMAVFARSAVLRAGGRPVHWRGRAITAERA